jgi:UDP-N-acetylmuramate dehydrogenase
VSSVITQVEAVDVHTQQSESFSAEQCCFSYRNSIFKEQWLGKKVITHVTFSLVKKTHGEVHYKDLIQYFKKHPQEQTLSAIRKAVLEVRAFKSMVLNTSDPNGKSAGSFFTNPILTAEQAQALKKKAGETLPLYAYGEGHKTSAAWLIENSGFHKGFKLGNAALSSKHTLALINPGNAMAQDLIALAQKIQKTVDEKWGIRLIPEPQFWGFEKHPLA